MPTRNPKDPEKRAALIAKHARQAEEGAAAWLEYKFQQAAARDKLLRLRRERIAREKFRCVGVENA